MYPTCTVAIFRALELHLRVLEGGREGGMEGGKELKMIGGEDKKEW